MKGQFVRVRSDGVSELVNTLAETEKVQDRPAVTCGVCNISHVEPIFA